MRVSAVLIAKNEARNLPRLFAGLTWVDEIVVVDDFSTDDTKGLAEKFGALVYQRRHEDFASQRNYGLEQAGGEWILSLDADEEMPPACGQAIREALASAGPEIGGFRILRRNIVLGRWLKHGQQYGSKVHWYSLGRRLQGYRPGEYLGGAVKVFRNDARFQNEVHEEPAVEGKIIQLQAYVNHYTGNSVQEIFDKNNTYTTVHARMENARRPHQAIPFAAWVLWRPLAVFFRNYVRKLGFLDGRPGLIRCLADMHYEFLKNLKWHALSTAAPLADPEPVISSPAGQDLPKPR